MRLWLGLLVFAVAQAASAAVSLETVYSNMDRAAASFRGMEAKVEWVAYTALVDDKSVEAGAMKVRRPAAGDADLVIHFTEPYPKDVLITGAQVEIYKPKIKTVEEYDLSDSKDKINQALLVGFGASGKTIRESYDVKLLGEETVTGEPTVHLELIPKDAETRKSLKKLEMWVSTKSWQSVQQKLIQDSSGDYRLYTYTDIELNPALKDSDFKLDLPRGVKRISPRK